MKFVINRSALLERINTASKAITVPNALPVLTGFWIRAQKDSLMIFASDKTFTIQTFIYPGELTMLNVAEPGDVVLEAKFLGDIVRKLEGRMVTIETETSEAGGRRIAIIGDEFNTYRLTYHTPEKHQEVVMEPRTNTFALPSEAIKDIVREVGYCTAPETEARVVLKGINLKANGRTIRAGATDSFRMAIKNVDLDAAGQNTLEEADRQEPLEFSFSVPLRPLRELSRALPDNEMVSISAARKSIRFDYGNTTFQTALLEGKFPNLDSIVPDPAAARTTLEVNGKELERLVDRAMVFYNSDNETMRFVMSEKELKIYTTREGVGESDLTLMEGDVRGEALKLTCNGRYLLEALRAMQPENNVILQFYGELGPFRITDPDKPESVVIIVPIRSYD